MDREDEDFGRDILTVGADFSSTDGITILSRCHRSDDDDHFVVYCSTENYDRTRQMLVDMYVALGVSREAATLHYFGPPKPAPRRPDPLQVAFDIVTAHEAHKAISKMGLAVAESVRVMNGVSASLGYAIEELNRQLIEGPDDSWSRLKQEHVISFAHHELSSAEYHKVFSEQISSLGKRPDEPQARKRGKKKRGHNSDRDRVICKKGYC